MTTKEFILSRIIPEIVCPPGCGLCCEVGYNAKIDAHGNLGWDHAWHNGEAKPETEFCDKHTLDKRCSIYADRKLVCRLYAKRQGESCLFGLSPDHPLDIETFRRIVWCWRGGTEQDAKAIVAGFTNQRDRADRGKAYAK